MHTEDFPVSDAKYDNDEGHLVFVLWLDHFSDARVTTEFSPERRLLIAFALLR